MQSDGGYVDSINKDSPNCGIGLSYEVNGAEHHAHAIIRSHAVGEVTYKSQNTHGYC